MESIIKEILESGQSTRQTVEELVILVNSAMVTIPLAEYKELKKADDLANAAIQDKEQSMKETEFFLKAADQSRRMLLDARKRITETETILHRIQSIVRSNEDQQKSLQKIDKLITKTIK